MVSSFLGELAIQRKGEGYKYPLQKCDRCSSLSPETPHWTETPTKLQKASWSSRPAQLNNPAYHGAETPALRCGNSGETPEQLRAMTCLCQHSPFHNLDRPGRRLRLEGPETPDVRKLRSNSGPLPHQLLLVPTSGYTMTSSRMGGDSGPEVRRLRPFLLFSNVSMHQIKL